jgi:ribosomal protein S18 acetylase RimI-like enzyme
MAVEIRQGRNQDADFLAWVMLSASRAHLPRGVWDLIIGGGEAICLDYLRRLAVAEPRSLCHYENFLVADVDGHAAAALSGYDMKAGGWALVGEAMAKVQRDLGWTDADVAISQQRVGPAWACFLPDIGADWGIENVATRPEYRRKGLIKTLLNSALRESVEHDGKLVQIITYIGNDEACAAYRKSGFRVLDEKRCAGFEALLGSPGFMRMICDL